MNVQISLYKLIIKAIFCPVYDATHCLEAYYLTQMENHHTILSIQNTIKQPPTVPHIRFSLIHHGRLS